jgi:hypothetical protein
MAELSPIESEFLTTEQAEAHDQWFRAKVTASLSNTEPGVPHEVVMDDVRAIIETAQDKRRKRG